MIRRGAGVGSANGQQMATTRALSYCSTPGRSWTRAMRPAPIWPTFMRLEGANWPKTEAGTMEGKPMAAAWINSRRERMGRMIGFRCIVSAPFTFQRIAELSALFLWAGVAPGDGNEGLKEGIGMVSS